MKEMGKSDYIKIKNVCFLKDSVQKMKREDADRQKPFADHICVKGLASGTYKELSKVRRKQTAPPPPRKKAKDLNRHFTKADI